MRVRSRFLIGAAVVAAVPIVVTGVDAVVRWKPRPDDGVAARVTAAADLDRYLALREDSVPGLKSALRKGIVWHDSTRKSRTPFAIVYLHGFSASRAELSPVVEHLADSLGANAFFTRLAAHGRVDGEAFGTVGPQQWVDDAREALAVGRRLGERVILVGTSTGALLAMELAAESRDSTAPAALLLVSPNHAPADWRARFVAGPFGPTVARLLGGSYRSFTPENAAQEELWTTRYRSAGVAALMDLVLYAQTIDVSRVMVPTLTLYTHRDDVVRVDLIRSRHAAFGSRVKEIVDVPEATGHVLAGDALAPQAVDPLVALMLRFLRGMR
jgi:alpha-beta hydrolase superfamily lysophospholipase